MVPVDLEHADRLESVLCTAAALASHYGTIFSQVGVEAATPGRVEHTPQEFARRVEEFARAEAGKHGRVLAAR